MDIITTLRCRCPVHEVVDFSTDSGTRVGRAPLISIADDDRFGSHAITRAESPRRPDLLQSRQTTPYSKLVSRREDSQNPSSRISTCRRPGNIRIEIENVARVARLVRYSAASVPVVPHVPTLMDARSSQPLHPRCSEKGRVACRVPRVGSGFGGSCQREHRNSSWT